MYYSFHKNIKLFSTLIIIRIFLEQQISILISEGPCDTEDWSNNAENSALITEINYILKYIQTENIYLNCNIISQYYSFYCIFDQINAALLSRRDFFQKP